MVCSTHPSVVRPDPTSPAAALTPSWLTAADALVVQTGAHNTILNGCSNTGLALSSQYAGRSPPNPAATDTANPARIRDTLFRTGDLTCGVPGAGFQLRDSAARWRPLH